MIKIFKISLWCFALILASCANSNRSSSFGYGRDKKLNKIVNLGYQELVLTTPLTKQIDSFTSKENITGSGCLGWKIDESKLENIFTKMELVSPVEWNAICYHLPCSYKGEVSNGHFSYEIEINAASYIVLQNKNDTLIFIAKEKLDIFLLACNCCF